MTNQTLVAIITGVLSGILTNAILFLVSRYFSKVLLPWYQQVVYHGVLVGGEWQSTVTPFDQSIKLVLSQKATALTGSVTYINDLDKQGYLEKIRSFSAEGSISDRFIQLNLTHVDKTRIGVVTYVLEVVGDGRKLVGSSSHYDLSSLRIAHADIAFSRDGAK